jgi:hypothetical protein
MFSKGILEREFRWCLMRVDRSWICVPPSHLTIKKQMMVAKRACAILLPTHIRSCVSTCWLLADAMPGGTSALRLLSANKVNSGFCYLARDTLDKYQHTSFDGCRTEASGLGRFGAYLYRHCTVYRTSFYHLRTFSLIKGRLCGQHIIFSI